MMMRYRPSPRRFTRDRYLLPYRRNFIIVPEGEKTEKSYLQHVHRELDIRTCNLIFARTGGSIRSLIKCAEKNEKKVKPESGDTIWIVLDYDPESHFPEQFVELAAWENKKNYHHVAISSPRFEIWLLMHTMSLSDAKKIVDSDSAVEQILPGFKQFTRCKHRFDKATILSAVERARKSQYPTSESPNIPGSGMPNLLNDMLRAEPLNR